MIWSKIYRKTSIPMRVVAYLCILFAVGMFLSAMMQEEFSKAKPAQLRLALMLAAAGGGLLIAHFLFFSLPHMIMEWRSPTRQRRTASFKRMARPDAKKEGGVLVLTLVLLALMTVLLVQSQALARGRLRGEEAADQTAALRRAATEAVYSAMRRLADDPDLAVDTTNETWALREDITSPLGVGLLTQVTDGASRFDLNNLALSTPGSIRPAGDILMDMLTLCGDFAPSARMVALTDYVDDNPAGLYERDYCAKQVPPAACPNRALYGWGELLSVAGWSKELFARKVRAGVAQTFDADLVDLVTVMPFPREKPLPININTASRETLTGVLGLGQDALVASILALRAIKPIRDVETLEVMAEQGFFQTVRPYLSVRSSLFEIQAQAYKDGRTAQVRALASRDREGRVDIVQWLF